MVFLKCGKASKKQKNTSFSLGLCFITDAPGTDLGYTLLTQVFFSKVISYSAQQNNLLHTAAPSFCSI